MTAPISRDSGDWRPLKSWLLTQIHNARRELEATDVTVGERAHDISRGRIAAFSEIIQSVEPGVRLEADKLEGPVIDERAGY